MVVGGSTRGGGVAAGGRTAIVGVARRGVHPPADVPGVTVAVGNGNRVICVGLTVRVGGRAATVGLAAARWACTGTGVAARAIVAGGIVNTAGPSIPSPQAASEKRSATPPRVRLNHLPSATADLYRTRDRQRYGICYNGPATHLSRPAARKR